MLHYPDTKHLAGIGDRHSNAVAYPDGRWGRNSFATHSSAYISTYDNAFRIASPTPLEDAGFWPVIIVSSTTTLAPHGSLAFSYCAPSSVSYKIISGVYFAKGGMYLRLKQPRKLLWCLHLCLLFFDVGEASHSFAFENRLA
jgi:hypothetical protein